MVSSADVMWAALIASGLVYEVAAIRSKRWKDTLSDTTRKWFMTEKTAGKVAFGVAWVGFAGWYFWHILWQ